MTKLDDILVPKVKEILDNFGTSATWFQNDLEAYNPLTGEGTKLDGLEVTLTISPPVKKQSGQPLREMYEFYLAASGAPGVPEVGDTIEFGGERVTVTEVQTLYSGTSIAAYLFLCR
jgi:hypothetical protein